MITSVIIICLIAFGGMALTYLVVDDESFMWRLAAGSIVGSALFGLIGFVLALGFGFGVVTVGIAMAVTVLPVVLLTRKEYGGNFRHDWAKAKGKFQGGTLKRFAGFGYYAFFFVLFWFFFGQALFETAQGIFTGGTQNLGDLPFHLGAIYSFTDGNNFPPQNPSFSGARFSYPFIADFLTACFMKAGADVKSAMFVQNLTWAFSLVVVLERFTVKLTGSKLAGRIAPFLLVFSGGLGFAGFFKDYWAGAKGLWDLLWALPRDYTIGDNYRWGNSLVVLFITQRSILLGMPLTIMVLGYLWRTFSIEPGKPSPSEAFGAGHDKKNKKNAKEVPKTTTVGGYSHLLRPLLVGLLAGTLPLIHLHSLAVLFVVTGFLFIFKPSKWLSWVVFGAGVGVIAIPELLWSMSGTATETSKFIGWNFGWDKRDDNFLWFWVKNTGLVIPIIAAGIYLLFSRSKDEDAAKPAEKHGNEDVSGLRGRAISLSLFYVPFVFIFVVSNVVKLAPWEWDNIKVLIYWFVGSIPLIAYAIAWAWSKGTVFKVVTGCVLMTLTLAGALDIWRTASGQVKAKVFDADARNIAEQIKQKVPPNALFLNAPTYNSAVVLSGRRSFMRYSGHLSSHGIDYSVREDETKLIYQGGGMANVFLRDNNIEYVLMSPEERKELQAKDETFAKYPVIAESGQYKVYKIK